MGVNHGRLHVPMSQELLDRRNSAQRRGDVPAMQPVAQPLSLADPKEQSSRQNYSLSVPPQQALGGKQLAGQVWRRGIEPHRLRD